MSEAQHGPMATLRLFADDLKPGAITDLLRIEPSAAAEKGQPFNKKVGVHRAEARVGTWFVTTEGQHIGDKPEYHLAWVLNLAMANLKELRRLNPGMKMDFSLVVFGKHFELRDIPRDLLKIAVLLGELQIEMPEKGIDILLNSRNLAAKLRRVSADRALTG